MKAARIIALAALVVFIAVFAGGCNFGPSDADVAAKNISTAAEQFKVARKIVFINGITDKYLLEVDGYCSVETSDSGLTGAIAATCKVGKDAQGKPTFKKVFVGLSDNVTYTVQQIDPINVSVTRYKVIFKPEAIVPDIDRP